ncbi:MAG: hypothetical protein IH946_08210 [Bacteroidetes bacterium]|nr:hypothetical protein [Bacteroidota bacterium]
MNSIKKLLLILLFPVTLFGQEYHRGTSLMFQGGGAGFGSVFAEYTAGGEKAAFHLRGGVQYTSDIGAGPVGGFSFSIGNRSRFEIGFDGSPVVYETEYNDFKFLGFAFIGFRGYTKSGISIRILLGPWIFLEEATCNNSPCNEWSTSFEEIPVPWVGVSLGFPLGKRNKDL